MLRNGTVTLHQHKTRPACVLAPAPLRPSAFIPSALRRPAFKILKLVHVYFTTPGTNCRVKGRVVGFVFLVFLLSVHAKALQTELFWSKLQRSRSKGECKGAFCYLKQDEQIGRTEETRQVTTKTRVSEYFLGQNPTNA